MLLSDVQTQAVRAIRQSYSLLSKESDLSPENPAVTESLTHLVRTLTQCQSPELVKFLMTTPELAQERDHLPILCGQAECEMEKYWAWKLMSSPACNLADFWYFPEYAALCEAEIKLFEQYSFKRVSFLGSGALPMTAFMLAQRFPEMQVVCVDFDEEACLLARSLSEKIGLKDRVEIRCMNAIEYRPDCGELVIVASLMQGREALYRHLDANKCCGMIVRDSEGPYRYLYKAAELPRTNFREVSKTRLDARRINTSRLYVPQHDERDA